MSHGGGGQSSVIGRSDGVLLCKRNMPANISQPFSESESTLAFSVGGAKRNPKLEGLGFQGSPANELGGKGRRLKQTITEQLVGSRTHG